MAVRIICALLATVFIAVLFQVRKENIFAAAIGGGLGCLVNECGLALGLGTFFSIFLASLALASYSEIMARVRKTTVTTFLISGLFPLVPGAGMYYTMLAIVHNDLSEALSHDLDLEAADGACEGVYLAVQIRRRDAVKIHEREFADPGARQRFCCPGANAADTEHDDMRSSEFGDGVGAKQAFSSIIKIFHLCPSRFIS